MFQRDVRLQWSSCVILALSFSIILRLPQQKDSFEVTCRHAGIVIIKIIVLIYYIIFINSVAASWVVFPVALRIGLFSLVKIENKNICIQLDKMYILKIII